jgi:Ni,Fe-hydrogenase III small subunit
MDEQSINRPMTVLRTLTRRLTRMFSRRRQYLEQLHAPESAIGQRSVFIRHLDCGSCNGCELELNALSNPIYDIEQFGIRFESSPRHADILVMTGPFTRNLEEAARLTFEAMPEPRWIMTIGDCAKDGGIFRHSYAIIDRPMEIEEAIKAHVPGCPPTPADILKILAALTDQSHE